MKHKTFACPKLIFAAFFPWEIPIVVLGCIISENKSASIMYGCVLYFSVSAIVSLIYRNAFAIVHIDENGIRNNHTKLKWEEIENAGTVSIELLKTSLLPTIQIDVLYFSKQNGKKSFFKTDKNTVFISSTEKNREYIKKCSNGAFCNPKPMYGD